MRMEVRFSRKRMNNSLNRKIRDFNSFNSINKSDKEYWSSQVNLKFEKEWTAASSNNCSNAFNRFD